MSNPTQTSSQTNTVKPPAYLNPLLRQGAMGETNAIENLPSLTDLYGMVPQQGTAALTPGQLGTIGQYQNLSAGANPTEQSALGPLGNIADYGGANNATTQAGLGTLGEYASGGIGQDPATQAAMEQFGALTSPAIAQNAALQGRANSGAALEAQAQGANSALAPFLEQSQANQLNAANSLVGAGQQQTANQLNAANAQFGAGNSLNNQALNTLQAQLQAEGLPQQVAQQVANSLYQQQLGQFQTAESVQQEPFNLFGNVLGSVTGGSTSTPLIQLLTGL